MSNALFTALKKNIRGQVSSSEASLSHCAQDKSIFELRPQIVVAPKDAQDLQSTVEIARDFQATIQARGGGSGVTGGALGDQIVIDFRLHMHQVIDIQNDHAWVQPGVFLEELNNKAKPLSKHFAPDPGSRAYASFGGAVANNAAGAHGLTYGMTRDHVLDIDCVLSDGRAMRTSDMPGRFHTLTQTMKEHRSTIEDTTLKVSKNSSGFFLETFLADTPDFAALMTGSEGQLALFQAIKVKLTLAPSKVMMGICHFSNRLDALDAIADILKTTPACVELVDQTIQTALVRGAPNMCEQLGVVADQASLWIEWFGNSGPDELPKNLPLAFQTQDPALITKAWQLRSQASVFLHQYATTRQPLRCIEDACVPVKRLRDFVSEVEGLLTEHDCQGAIFGHVGNGHVHINPGIDVTKPDLKSRIENLCKAFYPLVLKYNGTISGEHGDGYLRQAFLQDQWGARMDLFKKVKDTFDPKNTFGTHSHPKYKQFCA